MTCVLQDEERYGRQNRDLPFVRENSSKDWTANVLSDMRRNAGYARGEGGVEVLTSLELDGGAGANGLHDSHVATVCLVHT